MRTVFDVKRKEKRIEELEEQIQKPDFWQEQEKAIKINQELADLKKEIRDFIELKKELNDLEKLRRSGEKKREKEIEEKRQILENRIKNKEFQVFLSGEHDKRNAILSIYAGAGGIDAQDWATMLLRMYERYCDFKGFKTAILDQSFGEAGGPEGRIGTKSVTLEIKGKYAFGFLKKEAGVHRLVRISPFSSKSLRHTSFALVEILPEISEIKQTEINIKPEDLKIDYYRASGPGGQYVNKRETAVRITHLPSGVKVSCQKERLQGLNKDKAMKVLLSRLFQKEKEKAEKEIKQFKGKNVSVGWGNQVRSYVLDPYKLVKDLRTGIEKSDVEKVLDGNLDEFIEAEILR